MSAVHETVGAQKPLIIHDWDGHLVDSFVAVFDAYQQMCVRWNHPPFENIEEFRAWVDMDWHNDYRRLGIPESDWVVADELFRVTVAAHPIALFPGIREMLFALAPTHVQVIVSNQNRSEILARLEQFGISQLFAQVYAAQGVPLDKAVTFSIAMREFSVAPEYTTAIGDYPSDVVAARAAHVGLVIASGYGWPAGDQLSVGCVQAGVSPDFIVASPADIVSLVLEKMND